MLLWNFGASLFRLALPFVLAGKGKVLVFHSDAGRRASTLLAVRAFVSWPRLSS